MKGCLDIFAWSFLYSYSIIVLYLLMGFTNFIEFFLMKEHIVFSLFSGAVELL